MTIDCSPPDPSPVACLSSRRDADSSRSPVVLPSTLHYVPLRSLRVWSDKLFGLLDTGSTARGVLEDYQRIQAEMDRRETALDHPSTLGIRRLRFRDNSDAGRFELHDGASVSAILTYSLHEDRVILLDTAVHSSYRGTDLQTQLIMQVLDDAHRRRLSVVAACRYTQEFLKVFPRYQSLVAMG